jgi:uncharacterized phage-associated protein
MAAYRFHLAKTIEAVGILMRDAPGLRMSRIRLLKLLYIADRECMRSTGRPITGDRVVAMAQGPVLSRVYDCIKGACGELCAWEAFFVSEGVGVVMKNPPAVGELSRFEIEMLRRVSRERADKDEWQIVDETHEFPEWIANDPGQSSKPIPFEEILAAVGWAAQANGILNEAAASADIAMLLEG